MTRLQTFLAGRTNPELYEAYLTPGVFLPWAEAMMRAEPYDGAILDLACGTGAVSRTLARHLAPGARIEAVDIAPPMLDLASVLIARDGVADRVSLHLASAAELPFGDASFDHGFCQQGVQFFPDKVAALREVGRVLKPGAMFTASVWTACADGNPAFHAYEESVARHLGADLAPLGPFAFGDAKALRAIFDEAGFSVHSLERRSIEVALPDVETFALFEMMFVGRPSPEGALMPVIAADDPAGDAAIQALIADLTPALAPYGQPDGTLRLPMTAHVVIAEA